MPRRRAASWRSLLIKKPAMSRDTDLCGECRPRGVVRVHRLLLSGLVALAVMATTSVAAQPFTEAAAARAIRDASALAARIRGYLRWQGLTPPPAGYCATMQAGEAVVKELARLASRAIFTASPAWRCGSSARATCSATRSTRRR